ncbi:signal peptidase I [Georgenia sp. TF02-10]|uniref:signal peptidase I n=1 Tax=Georgenia sp. TF02-10 TaxID=2917725 RepID=UPI001FA751D8|nr:signal peptidase I [Georgenia sp. TF02-10]UNX55896.1 signal peptidase I [Georgenia sp. TF02-10]
MTSESAGAAERRVGQQRPGPRDGSVGQERPPAQEAAHGPARPADQVPPAGPGHARPAGHDGAGQAPAGPGAQTPPAGPGGHGRPAGPADRSAPMPPSFPPAEPGPGPGPGTAPARRPGRGTDHPRSAGAAPAGRAGRRGKDARPRRGGWFRETFTVLVSALVLSVLIKTFLAQAFYIPSGSMEDTLELGDRVMVNKLAPNPFDLQRGDVVVFVDPDGWLGELPPDTRPAWQRTVAEVLTWVGLLPQDAGQHLIKRVIGLGGDEVACCTAEGQLTVNGEPLEEPYLKPGAAPSETEFDVVVPADHVWVMGDNRSNSADSRAHLGDPGGGMVPVDEIVGRAFVVLWPLDRIALLNNPEDTFAGVPDPAR